MARKEIVSIDVGQATNSVDLHLILKESLDFLDFYGKNWDAFWDAITGLVELPLKIIFEKWNVFAQNLPEEAEYLRKILICFNQEHPEWQVEIVYS